MTAQTKTVVLRELLADRTGSRNAPHSAESEAVETSPSWTLFDAVQPAVAASSTGATGGASSFLDRFFAEASPARALDLWLGDWRGLSRREIAQRLNRDIAFIDRLVNEQLNELLHQPAFQDLEGSWRGLYYLWSKAVGEGDSAIKVKVLSASWRELDRDFERAIEFDQSQLFRKVYENEFGTAGGEPFGLLLGDYEIHPRPAADHPHNDMSVLSSISQIAAAAFCPFVTAASPALFGLDDFSTLEQRLDHAKTFDQLEYVKWRAFRDSEDSRFVGLVLPRVLMRPPYRDDGTRLDEFVFQEDVAGPDQRKYLWGNAAYAFGAVVVRAFAEAGWLADIRGVRRAVDGGGLVTGLATHSFGTDRDGVALKTSTDVVITDQLEKELSELGFIPLCPCHDTPYSAFYSNQSTQKAKRYDRQAATTNAKISAMLQYMLCVSRFAHYVKILGRDKLGAFGEAEELEAMLQNWIVRYVTSDSEASAEVKARFPLREARVEVRERPDKPGAYDCVMQLAPHYELDELQAAVRINTQLAPGRSS